MPATQILVIGDQGSGKSTAWETMNPEETLIISPNAKPLPWPGSAKQYLVGKNRIQTKQLTDIPPVLEKINKDMPHIKHVLIEDITHFFNARTTSADFTSNSGYGKWGVLANDILKIIDLGQNFRDDLFIVYNAHTEMHEDETIGMLSPGKLLDREIKPPSYFTYVFHALVGKGDHDKITYTFLTNKNGRHDAKTPRGCFRTLTIPNDIKTIVNQIKEYQGVS